MRCNQVQDTATNRAFRLTTFDLDKSEVAEHVYGDHFNMTTPQGVVLNREVTEELRLFMDEYAEFLGISTPYFRADLYPDANGDVHVLEVNASFVDGWGLAYNLSRAANLPMQIATFPYRFAYEEEVYLPELRLLVEELAHLGQHHVIEKWRGVADSDTYVYGRVEQASDHIFPWNGVEMDLKLNLRDFSKQWQGRRVHIPRMFAADTTPWSCLPSDIFMKFVDKSSGACLESTFSVKKGKHETEKFGYFLGDFIAQQEVPLMQTMIHPEFVQNVQIVVLASADALAGYVQLSAKDIINDNSIHAPLCFEGLG